MGLIVTTPPDVQPITLDEARLHLLHDDGTADDHDDDTLIESLIIAATEYVEKRTRQVFITRTFQLTLDSFPSCRTITLPRPPLVSVTSIVYTDAAGDQQTLSASVYTVDVATRPGRIVLKSGQGWPQTTDDANAVTITFSAGYGDADAVPELLKAAIKLLVGHWFENREAATEGALSPAPMAVESIITMNAFPEVV
jgi:uncharacterized phiE125 gp8 family phage protein